MGKKVGIKVTDGQIHILQRLLSGKSPGPMLREASAHDQNMKENSNSDKCA